MERIRVAWPGVRGIAVRTPTLPPATHTNCWVLGEGQRVVVDPASPWPEEQEALAAELGGAPLARIVLTHHHPDHVGGARDLRRRTGAPILAHPRTADRLPFAVDGPLDEGDLLDTDHGTWRVLWTPGHAPGHLCLHRAADGVLLAGDMVAGVGTIVLDPPEGVLAEYLGSLERLRALAPSVLLPAHGPPIPETRDARAAVAWLDHYVAHRHERTAQVVAGLRGRATPATPADLVPGVYTDVPVAFHAVAARQVLCHLLWLRDRGRVIETGGRFCLEEHTDDPTP